ncbi:N-acetylglucosaminyl-phosphatidylinositol de-N-acetylase isoform X1 [Polypterus senegalus]|uniref:N-acetylglucosaminyl-phosphatidylinositol de-N-acetylase isoform X1 n=1 Tax=Polypterus senegalus TaxID=55291 RepID=UPI00196519AC|nr:N-acetylglucosaminyl-phosphatidylinositol de-N-acetylase isoform X1 [Polypterus senegalus]
MYALLSAIVFCLVYYGLILLLYYQYESHKQKSRVFPFTSKFVQHEFFRKLSCSENCNDRSLRALFVTAHPDDECMFFAPAIIQLRKLGFKVYLLCLSTGNYYSEGETRKKELQKSCSVLGIPSDCLTVINHSGLQDDPLAEWETELVSSLILTHVKNNSIQLVLTFDAGGVSRHANHIALFKSLSFLSATRQLPEGCSAVVLETVNIFRKYLSVLDTPVSWLMTPDLLFILTRKEYEEAKTAMHCHRSQMLWFRYMYILFSRYMLTNTYRCLSEEQKIRKPE